MWILRPSALKANEYKKLIKSKLDKSFDDNDLFIGLGASLRRTAAYKYFTRDVVMQYLDADSQQLMDMHDTMLRNVGGKQHVLSKNNKKVVAKIFDYQKYIGNNKSFAYQLARLMDSNTCCYCNRQYTLTVYSTDGPPLIRPFFDHWFPQCDYPDLALSYYNLVPSCSYCNSSLKHDNHQMDIEKYIHPYVDTDAGFRFSYRPTSDGNVVQILVTALDPIHRKRVENTLNLFHTEDIYSSHSDFELKDILDLSQEYPGDYIDFLVDQVMSDLQFSKEEAYRTLFGIESETSRFLNRPFSKFKTDIINELRHGK